MKPELFVPLLALALAACQQDSGTRTAEEDHRESDAATVAGARQQETAAAQQTAPVSPVPGQETSAERTPSTPEGGAAPEAGADLAAAPAGAPAPVAGAERTPAARPSPAAAPVAAPASAPEAAPAATPAPTPDPAMTSVPSDTPPASGQPAAPRQKAEKATGSLQVSPAVYGGWKYFAANCERCHGQDAVGSSFAPSLVRSVGESSKLTGQPLTEAQFKETVTEGRLDKGMPAWKELLTTEQTQDIWEYMKARGSGELLPGRPTRTE